MLTHVALSCLLLWVTFGLWGCGREPSSSQADAGASSATGAANPLSDPFVSLMNAGKNSLDQGDATNALAFYRKAAALVPNDTDVHLNLANACLLAGAAEDALREADQVLQLEPNSAAAYFVKGSACLHLGKPEEAVKALENSQKIDPGETATWFQLGRARVELRQWDAAITAFKQGLATDPNHLHTTAHYLLGRALLQAGRQDEAQQELLQHQASLEAGGAAVNVATFERSKHTQARVPFKLEQPDPEGITMTFVDATREAFGESAQTFAGPVGLLDVNHTGWQSLFVTEDRQGFRLLLNTNGTFIPAGPLYPAIPGASYTRMLVGDLQNDRFEDVVVLGDKGSHVFKFQTNGVATDASKESRFDGLTARDGTLIDLDFTGKLDLVAATASTNGLRIYRQFGPLLFSDITSTSGVPASLHNVPAVVMEDWNRDGIMDLIAGRTSGPPVLLEKQRGGPLLSHEPTNWVAGAVICTGDFDNDLRPDLAIAGEGKVTLCYNGGSRKELALSGGSGIRQVAAIDHDNDGWLDLWVVGDEVQVWRNAGLSGFQDQTARLGLDKLGAGPVFEVCFADFDMDCDTDVVLALSNGGLRSLRNEGGNANSQVKVHLFGNRSNASGLGCKVEVAAGGLRLLRSVQRLPVEVGVGKYQTLDSFLVHWSNWPQGEAGVPVDCREPILALELTIQEGSCPYLYAWDGKRIRFVTDILGAAPLGLPVAEGCYTAADPEELVWIGDERGFPPRDGHYQLRITEELREVLYLDEAKLVVVDHEPGTEVYSTDKLLPDGPFPRGELLTLHQEHPLQRAETLDGTDVTAGLRRVDGHRASPPRIRIPQLRGLAELHGLILDFGPLDAHKPLVLVLNGWIRFGGGMANIAASHDPALPFPFPVLEAETAPGLWSKVDVVVGAPAGKTKTILVDLEGKLEPGTRRLRLTEAFEIHWDRIALMEKRPDAATKIAFVAPTRADLRFRGFSALEDLPPDCPLTPDYDAVSPNSCWTVTPGGWCTRYGDVLELAVARDEGLVLINAGDELSLDFSITSLPPKPPGTTRDFFLYADGWDKDSDFHVATGTQVEPLPFHGMRDAEYGRQPRPPFPSDALHQRYNTRWVESRVLRQTTAR